MTAAGSVRSIPSDLGKDREHVLVALPAPCPKCNPSDGLTPPRLPKGYGEDDDQGTRH